MEVIDEPVIVGDIGFMIGGILLVGRMLVGDMILVGDRTLLVGMRTVVVVGCSGGELRSVADVVGLTAGRDCGLAALDDDEPGGGGSGAIFGPAGGGASRGGSAAGEWNAMSRLKDDVARCPGFVSAVGSTSLRKSRSSVESASEARSEEDERREKRLRKRETAEGAGAGAGNISGAWLLDG